jgi:pyroglutamyl-peptidase
MRTIVLSGFRAFGNYPVNPTEVVANQLNGCVLSGFVVRSMTFQSLIPQNDNGAILMEFARCFHAAAIISIGMASEKKGLCIERVAVNRIYNDKYCAGLNNTPVDGCRGYGEKLEADLSQWNIGSFRHICVSENIPVSEISEDAGGFCCNHLMYQVLAAQTAWQNLYKVPFIFLHVPCCPEAVCDSDSFTKSGKITMTTEKILRGLELLVGHSHIDPTE